MMNASKFICGVLKINITIIPNNIVVNGEYCEQVSLNFIRETGKMIRK